MRTLSYDRTAAVEYAQNWAYLRNPRYFAFDGFGGDCTNFASQCVYAGSRVMNFTPEYGWYYLSPDERSASWSGVEYFYSFIVSNGGEGPYGADVPIGSAEPGDIVQLGGENGRFYHSLVITHISGAPSYDSIRVSAHDNDVNLKRLSLYSFAAARFIHIAGVRSA
ncbi:MAG: amidase domain-containing protein [Clostridia bacterium]|nr:amidase domain-containing protein [Clostridia bacterium]